MERKILVTSTDVMMYQFLLPHVQYLHEHGYGVDVVCSHAEGYQKEGYHEYIKEHLPEGSLFFPVSLERNPFSSKNASGLKELKQIMETHAYDLIWTNEPVMGVMTRLAAKKARKAGTKVFYLAHGYHFYQGAPKKNWLAYPVEKFMAPYCDAMCMINWEDYEFTKKHMPKIPVYHIDGIGLDVAKFRDTVADRDKKRAQYGFSPEDIVILSVGELQTRKNHEPMLRAIGELNDPRLKYMICGRGELEEHLKAVAKELGMADRLVLPGHVYDIPEILKSVDIFAHPSLREGLGISALEAMAAGLPLVTSNVQGMKDYVINGKTGYVTTPHDVQGYKKGLQALISDPALRKQMGENNMVFAEKYDISNSQKQVYAILEEVLSGNAVAAQ